MRVADFFCGAGGFSEGFRQMGFEMVFGLDNWGPAIDTIRLNHPGIEAVKMDILDLETPEYIDEIVPDTEIIIGSPPCVSFSGSNRAGKADKSLGVQLIETYLRIVAWKLNKPGSILKYWVLENVPNSQYYIKDRYTFEELGLPGGDETAIKVTQSNILNADDFGAPQGRKRFFAGNYPKPKVTHREGKKRLTRDILELLGDPLDGHEKDFVTDPCYDFKIPRTRLTDHFYDTTVAEWEWRRAKRLKEDHGFMGKMSFPEELNRTSRTIMATRSASTREAMVFGGRKDESGEWKTYRLPTIREIASIMSFPITYQFEAGNEASKYRLVGNAVCVLQSRAIARAIRKKEGLEIPKSFIPIPGDPMPTVDLTGQKRKLKGRPKKKPESRFYGHIPYLKIRGFRVELDNKKSDFKNDEIIWSSVLHQGSGKNANLCECTNEDIEQIIKKTEGSYYDTFELFKSEVEDLVEKGLPDSIMLQEAYCGLTETEALEPYELLQNIREIIDSVYPEENFADYWINNGNNQIGINRERIPLRVIVGLYALNRAINFINSQKPNMQSP